MILPAFAQDISPIPVVNGVSWELASYRKKSISNLNYKMDVTIPTLPSIAVTGTTELSFSLNDISQDLQIDFKADVDQIKSVRANGKRQRINHYNEHIIINRSALKIGKNKIKIKFIAGNDALNRAGNYLYTLFVPDRMRTSFPTFDQPNLKATFELTLKVPNSWETMSSAPIRRETSRNFTKTVRFEKSDKMSTYLFSFVAGRFNKIEANIDGLEMTMLHREPDADKMSRNVVEIFRLHKASLDYMEDYTGIKYPFKKFGFVLIPSFQFGGMEHVGAILYKDSSLILDKNPSTTDRLSRASLIGHETSHMWFGDLVTMDWFDDVWTKEVFANFFAGKVVNPSFPDVDHDLRSLLRLHPGAYAVDRSEGPNPIRQNLPNLNEAGTMYGAIIYNKAPIMMKQLETLIGEDAFRDGMREYLSTYAFSNATWPALIDILDKRSDQDLKAWSKIWVNTPGRPVFNLQNAPGQGLMLSQSDPSKSGRIWPQNFSIKKGGVEYDVSYADQPIDINSLGNSSQDTVLTNANGMGYGLFPIKKNYLRNNWDTLTDLERSAAFVNLYEQLMEGNGTISPQDYLELVIWATERENNPLIINHIMRQATTIFWSLFDPESRMFIAPSLEHALWQQVNNHKHDTGIKRIYFRNYADIALTQDALTTVKSVWDKSLEIEDLNLATRDYTNLAATLAIKMPDQAEDIIAAQTPRIFGPDNQARFKFLQFAISQDPAIRDAFFDALMNVKNRSKESWVNTALGYLHHPLRTQYSEKYLERSLDVLQEIQVTGDIFFPGRWLNSTFKYYQSDKAVNTVRVFLEKRPDYNYQLKLKILQSADQMFRANKILKHTP